MKQLFKSVLCAALSLLALSACKDDLQTLTDVSQPNFPNDPTACVLMADDFSWEGADTRTSLTVEDNVALFSWTTGDLVGILPDEGAQVYFAIPEPVTPTAGEEYDEQTTEQRLNASFDGGAWALKGENNYAAYYPFVEDFHLDRTAVPVDYTGQVQVGNASTAHLGAFDFMGARPATTNASGGVAFDFDHVGALVQLKFTVPEAGTALKSVTLKATDEEFTMKGTYNLTSQEGFPITAATDDATAAAMTIGMDYTTTVADEEVTLYFMCAPIDLSGKMVDIVVAYGDEDDVFNFVVDGKNLQAGRGSRLKVIPYLTFTAAAAQTFKMKTNSYTLPESLQYSVNGGEWTQVIKDEEVTFGGTNGNLRLRGKSSTGTADNDDHYGNIEFGYNTPVACTGDIRTLVDYENYDTTDTSSARFCSLFSYCTVLTTAPELPAMSLADYCYYEMFEECSSLTTAPELPATILARHCYDSMFQKCTSLNTAPNLPATTMENYCYNDMFRYCSSLITAPVISATTLAEACCSTMFYYCTSLQIAPELHAETLAPYCYSQMFKGCTALTTAPILKATTLAVACYQYMFDLCSNLKNITMLATDISATDCLKEWVNGVPSSGGTFTKAAAMKSLPKGKNGIPSSWTVVDYTE